jgi:hypothetical protein
VPPGPSPEELREQRERDAEKARKDAEHRLKCKQEAENTPMMVYMRESRANIAIDRDYYRKLEAEKLAKNPPPQVLGSIGLTPEDQHKIRAAMDRAKADGRPLKLSLKSIKDILNDRF